MMNFKSFITASAALVLCQGVVASAVRRWETAGPSCPDFTPFVYEGCFYDPSSPRALPFSSSSLNTQNMTVEICVAFCKGNDYRYAGLEYYGECFCGASVAGPQISQSNCTFPCTGNSSEICGGNDILSVYGDPTFPYDNTSTISDYQSAGCWTDNSTSGRTLVYMQDLDPSNMTVEACLFSCKDAGYSLAGVEYASQCFCGVVLGNGTEQVDSSYCNMPCNGNTSEICGGPALLNLYVAPDLESDQPCIYTTTSSTTQSSTTTSSTSTTSSAPLCTATIPPTCEYSCGSWCSKPLPNWSTPSDCKLAATNCQLQVAACFANAPFPDSLDCWGFSNWCQSVSSYCGSQSGVCSKSDCFSKYPPTGPPYTPSVSVYTCPVTTTTTTTKSSTTSSTSIPVPTCSNICQQPNNPNNGYTSSSPCGGIPLPCLTCNDNQQEFNSGSCFKLYSNSDSSQCPTYGQNSVPQGCKDSCQTQYNSCVSVYAQSCKNNQPWQGDTYESASQKCQDQYNDCLNTNSGVSAGNRCSNWNSGWW